MNTYIALFAAVIGVHVVALLTPGPNVLIVSQTAISQSRRAGIVTGLGVSTGAMFWAALAVGGVGLLLHQTTWLYESMKVVGGLYLLYLGWHSWQHAKQPLSTDDVAPILARNDWMYYRRGLLTVLTNPKAIMFFASIFSAMFQPNLPRWVYMSAVAVVGVDAILYYSLLSFALSTRQAQAAYLRTQGLLDRLTGGLMIFFGVRLAFFH